MYITKPKRTSRNGKTYETILLRESYREGDQVKNRTLANLTHAKPEEVRAIELALEHKGNLASLASLQDSVNLQEGLSVGSVWAVYEVAKRLGIERALGTASAGKRALWQVIARVLEQGSRLSAVRLAQTHAACGVLRMKQGFDEDDLYANLKWLCEQQGAIERRLFARRHGDRPPELFLYDVTSSYFEGSQNELAAYGYSRDGKKGKKQIVVGLLCDESGEPVSTEVFAGNTQDPKTFHAQVRHATERFGCKRVTFAGDRGMVKSGQIEELSAAGFQYITAITKSQIETLLKQNVIQLELFEDELCEIKHEGIRYVLRRNPQRAAEVAASREDKRRSIETLAEKQNAYLREHARARPETALGKVQEKTDKLFAGKWLEVKLEGRKLQLFVNEAALAEAARLDGCYVIKTDLPESVADAKTVHNRYKDLAQVEWAFRTCKTSHLEIRPIYVRTEESTRGHVLVVMLAYMIVRELRRAWAAFDLTVEEGLRELQTLCSIELQIQDRASCQIIPQPREQSQALLDALQVRMPTVLPHRALRVVTKTKLPKRRRRT